MVPWRTRDDQCARTRNGSADIARGWALGRGSLSFSALGESDHARVFATLVLAFVADPVERWLYPEPLICASNMTLAPKQFSSAD